MFDLSEEKDYEKLDEMVKEESRKPEGETYCPECGSSRLYYFLGLKAGHIFVCKDCGYQGPVIIEDGEVAEEIRKDWIEKKSEDEGEESK